jgi:acyl-CoA synthetase (NDP forming)
VVNVPESISRFLSGKRIAVAGVSRTSSQAANAIYRKLRDSGYDAIPVNPRAAEVEGVHYFLDLGSVPGPVDGVAPATATMSPISTNLPERGDAGAAREPSRGTGVEPSRRSFR